MPKPVTAHANLQQTGANVDGTVDMSGFPTETIHVTVSGTRVNGTTEDASGAGTAVGVLVGARLSIVLHRISLQTPASLGSIADLPGRRPTADTSTALPAGGASVIQSPQESRG